MLDQSPCCQSIHQKDTPGPRGTKEGGKAVMGVRVRDSYLAVCVTTSCA